MNTDACLMHNDVFRYITDCNVMWIILVGYMFTVLLLCLTGVKTARYCNKQEVVIIDCTGNLKEKLTSKFNGILVFKH